MITIVSNIISHNFYGRGVKMVKYPNLESLMAQHRVNRTKLAKIIGKAPAAITGKLEGKIDFKWSDIKSIYEYFRQFIPDLTIEYIFYESDN
jgi:DNA-binding XRE family transcriptional regulator